MASRSQTRPVVGAVREDAGPGMIGHDGRERRGYFIAASYILATWSQLTRWSMKALR
jgi:hypothetical protein